MKARGTSNPATRHLLCPKQSPVALVSGMPASFSPRLHRDHVLPQKNKRIHHLIRSPPQSPSPTARCDHTRSTYKRITETYIPRSSMVRARTHNLCSLFSQGEASNLIFTKILTCQTQITEVQKFSNPFEQHEQASSYGDVFAVTATEENFASLWQSDSQLKTYVGSQESCKNAHLYFGIE